MMMMMLVFRRALPSHHKHTGGGLLIVLSTERRVSLNSCHKCGCPDLLVVHYSVFAFVLLGVICGLTHGKSEFIIFGSKYNRNRVPISHIRIGVSNIAVASKVAIWALFLTQICHLVPTSSSICSASSYHLRNIGLIRKYLTQDATEQLVHAFVTSRLDMGNSLLYGLPNNQIHRLSRLQHIAARIITKTKPREHITPVLKKLHWLPVPQRITFKILTYAYRSQTG